MTYEARKLLNDKYRCPKCGSITNKYGKALGKNRRICTKCKYQFYEKDAIIMTKIRVGIYNEHSIIVGIEKDFNSITLKDIENALPNKRIIGWCRE